MIRLSKLNEMFHGMNTNEVLLDVSVSPEKNMKNKEYNTRNISNSNKYQ